MIGLVLVNTWSLSGGAGLRAGNMSLESQENVATVFALVQMMTWSSGRAEIMKKHKRDVDDGDGDGRHCANGYVRRHTVKIWQFPLWTMEKIEVIAGVNLPMLIKLASIRDADSLLEAATGAQDCRGASISILPRKLLDKKKHLNIMQIEKASYYKEQTWPACTCCRQIRCISRLVHVRHRC